MTAVSVVIPTYNRPSFLGGAIRTALDQTHDEVEVIVVDDGSSRPYASETVDEFPPAVTCIEHETNRGLSAARNTGIAAADGEYIAFLDDDDRWATTKLAAQVAALEAAPESGLATCLCVSVSPDGDPIHVESSAPSGDLSDAILRKNLIGSPSRVLVRREALDQVGGFDETLPTKQDWDLYLRLCQEWHVAAVADHLCFRTAHESMSSSPAAIERDYAVVLNKHEKLIHERGYLGAAKAAIDERAGRAYLGTGELQAARQSLKRAVEAEPTKRRAALLALSYTHPTIVETAISVTRSLRLLVGSEQVAEAEIATQLEDGAV
ncbi:glycosyltransferase family 2 protein [Natronococcus occultus]|uniref:Glycosyl transferase n=1 Tax=Natronococcus occultus SP4 TaxID=694430 RepID=L0K3A9_9EURY|nr:glycosyltransferase family A protein [Natronococcus occultus]AGB38814.1 glycosyl transferase [Natronococcus occultus SP4]